MPSCTSKHTLKMSIQANALRCVELLDEIPVSAMNSSVVDGYTTQKAELKCKMHELRRDTVRMEKLLLTYERK
jgi:hypothetical protein